MNTREKALHRLQKAVIDWLNTEGANNDVKVAVVVAFDCRSSDPDLIVGSPHDAETQLALFELAKKSLAIPGGEKLTLDYMKGVIQRCPEPN